MNWDKKTFNGKLLKLSFKEKAIEIKMCFMVHFRASDHSLKKITRVSTLISAIPRRLKLIKNTWILAQWTRLMCVWKKSRWHDAYLYAVLPLYVYRVCWCFYTKLHFHFIYEFIRLSHSTSNYLGRLLNEILP